MTDTVAGLREVARLVRADGFPTEEVPGWETRGKQPVVPRAAVNHWTAGPREGNAPSLRTVTFGRPGLRNTLCNTYSSREPRLYLVAARTAWHAGSGSWRDVSGNHQALGHEAENSGGGEWTPRHLELIACLDRAQIAVFGYGVHMVCDHFEWTPRKIDRRDVGGPAWRQRISVAPELDEEEDVLQRGDRGGEVEQWQHTLNLGLYLTGGGFNGGGTTHDRNGSHLRVDGEFGDKTAVATWHLIRRVEIRLNRRSFYADHNRVSAVTQALIAAEIVRMLAADKAGEAV